MKLRIAMKWFDRKIDPARLLLLAIVTIVALLAEPAYSQNGESSTRRRNLNPDYFRDYSVNPASYYIDDDPSKPDVRKEKPLRLPSLPDETTPTTRSSNPPSSDPLGDVLRATRLQQLSAADNGDQKPVRQVDTTPRRTLPTNFRQENEQNRTSGLSSLESQSLLQGNGNESVSRGERNDSLPTRNTGEDESLKLLHESYRDYYRNIQREEQHRYLKDIGPGLKGRYSTGAQPRTASEMVVLQAKEIENLKRQLAMEKLMNQKLSGELKLTIQSLEQNNYVLGELRSQLNSTNRQNENLRIKFRELTATFQESETEVQKMLSQLRQFITQELGGIQHSVPARNIGSGPENSPNRGTIRMPGM